MRPAVSPEMRRMRVFSVRTLVTPTCLPVLPSIYASPNWLTRYFPEAAS